MHHRSQTHLGTWFTDGKKASFYDLSPLLVPLGSFLISTPRVNSFYTITMWYLHVKEASGSCSLLLVNPLRISKQAFPPPIGFYNFIENTWKPYGDYFFTLHEYGVRTSIVTHSCKLAFRLSIERQLILSVSLFRRCWNGWFSIIKLGS